MSSPAPSPSPKSASSPSDKDKAKDKAKGQEDSNSSFEDLADLSQRYASDLATLRTLLAASTPPRVCTDDLTCYRFLRGHAFDHAVAAKHLESTLAWREAHGLDALRKRAEKMEQRAFPHADKVLAVHPHNIIHGQNTRALETRASQNGGGRGKRLVSHSALYSALRARSLFAALCALSLPACF